MIAINFHKKLARIMAERSMSQKELAGLSGVPQGLLSRYINSKQHPQIETIAKIAAGLRVPITTFLDLPDEINSELSKPPEGIDDWPKVIATLRDEGIPDTVIDILEAWHGGQLSERRLEILRAIIDYSGDK